MKYLMFIVLVAFMSTQQPKEKIEMAITNDKGTSVRTAPKTPAWLGNGGVQTGVKNNNKVPAWYGNEYQAYMGPANAGDISNPNVPIAAIMQDASSQAVQNRIKYGAPNLGTSDVRYQNQAQAIGSGMGMNTDIVNLSGPQITNPYPDITKGHLRGSNKPYTVGEDNFYYDPETGIATQGGARYVLPAYTPPADFTLPEDGGGYGYGGGGRRGFGTNYGWGGGSSYRAPAWLPDMGLFSWNYKG